MMEQKKIVICGSRRFQDYERLKATCDFYLQNLKKTYELVFISGHARGADQMGERYARENGYSVIALPPDWEKDGRSAGIKRNIDLANQADFCIAFTLPDSIGTNHMIETCRFRRVPTRVINI